MFSGAPRLNFGSQFDVILGALGLRKNSEKCATVIKSSGLTLSRQGLFAGLDCGCVLIIVFFIFSDFLLFRASHFETFWSESW